MTGDAQSDGRPSPDAEVVEDVVERAESSIEYQMETLSDIDDKAIRIYRANVVFLSILVGAGSIATRQLSRTGRFVSLYSVAGLVLLLGSLAAGAVTYRSSDLRAGITEREIDRVFYEAQDSSEYYAAVGNTYRQYMEHNDELLRRNGVYITYTTILTVDALAYVFVGFLIALAGDPSPSVRLSAGLGVTGAVIGLLFVKIVSFPDRSPVAFLSVSITALAAAVGCGLLVSSGGGSVLIGWTYFPALVLAATAGRRVSRYGVVGYGIVLTLLCTIVQAAYLTVGSVPVLFTVYPSDFVTATPFDTALFLFVGVLLLLLNYRIY